MQPLKKHPIFSHADELKAICKPLQHLGITYFSHVKISDSGTFAALSNNTGFSEFYLGQQQYNHDVHCATPGLFEKIVVWDSIERVGQSLKMHQMAANFGVQHTFTIIKRNTIDTEYFHFANNQSSQAINQVYLSQYDLLTNFIHYFKETIACSPHLRHAFDIGFKIDSVKSAYEIASLETMMAQRESRRLFVEGISSQSRNSLTKLLSVNELSCIKLYAAGKTSKEIAAFHGLSYRTVENYIQNAKSKLGLSTKAELIIHFGNFTIE